MAEISSLSSSTSLSILWKENKGGGYAALIVISLIFIWKLFKFIFSSIISRRTVPVPRFTSKSQSPVSVSRTSALISDGDLKSLIDNLDEKADDTEAWENVTEKSRSLLSYKAKCCKPKDGPLKYMSVTVFENCSSEVLRDFYMDCEYRKQWDKTVVGHEQLQIDDKSGTEIGRTIKKFPLLTLREYVLAWKIWEGSDKTFYCFTKECEHPAAPRQRKYVRVSFFRSGWRIKQVPGSNACEIKMVHQEDAGLNVELAKLAFAKGIWSYVCKMDDALRKYVSSRHPQSSLTGSAVSFMQKVPPELDAMSRATMSNLGTSSSDAIYVQESGPNCRRLTRKPSRKLVANGLLLVGGLIYLSHGNCGLGAKVAVAFILKKLSKRGHTSSLNQQS